jgi:hypothetical protein
MPTLLEASLPLQHSSSVERHNYEIGLQRHNKLPPAVRVSDFDIVSAVAHAIKRLQLADYSKVSYVLRLD